MTEVVLRCYVYVLALRDNADSPVYFRHEFVWAYNLESAYRKGHKLMEMEMGPTTKDAINDYVVEVPR